MKTQLSQKQEASTFKVDNASIFKVGDFMYQTADVSVIIPLYNAGEYAVACINSILQQNVKPKEIVIVDDCSTDGSFELCQKFANQFGDFVKVLKLSQHSGVSVARNIGMNAAKGKYFLFVDADDFLLNDFLSILWSIAQISNADVIHPAACWVTNSIRAIPYNQQGGGYVPFSASSC